MKNPLAKDDHTGLIISIAIGAVAAGAAAYLFLTDEGAELRGKITEKVKGIIKDTAATVVSEKTGIPKKATKKAADVVVK